MDKSVRTCPFSNRACTECAIYRGRHRNLSFSKQHEGFPNRREEHAKSRAFSPAVEFRALRKFAEPRTRQRQTKDGLKIRVKVIDVETEETRMCGIHELEKWHWGNPRIWRLVDGRQVTDLDNLIDILHHKVEAGFEEVEIYEAPRFMVLAGG